MNVINVTDVYTSGVMDSATDRRYGLPTALDVGRTSDVRRPRTEMRAKFATTCAVCGIGIAVGDIIVAHRTHKGGWKHRSCIQAAR